MADINFTCGKCTQSMVVDESGAGVAVDCPQCGEGLIIPALSTRPAPEGVALEPVTKLISPARTAPTQAENEKARAKVLLSDALQQLGALRGELSVAQESHRVLRSELDRQTAELKIATKGWHEAKEAWDAGKAALAHNLSVANSATAERDELLGQVHETREHFESLEENHQTLTAEHAGTRTLLAQSEATIGALRDQLGTAKNDGARLTVELQRCQTELRSSAEKLATATSERTRLAFDLELNPDLARFVELRNTTDKVREQMAHAEFKLAEVRHDLNIARGQRDVLRKEKIDLELRYAAAREAVEGHQMHEDNELLRSLVDRLNEELRELGGQRRRRAGDSLLANSVSGLKRWIVERAFVPET